MSLYFPPSERSSGELSGTGATLTATCSRQHFSSTLQPNFTTLQQSELIDYKPTTRTTTGKGWLSPSPSHESPTARVDHHISKPETCSHPSWPQEWITLLSSGTNQLSKVSSPPPSSTTNLDSAQRTAMKAILGTFRTTPSTALQIETSLPPTHLRLRNKVLQLYARMRTSPLTIFPEKGIC
jgi:hypothetical protein